MERKELDNATLAEAQKLLFEKMAEEQRKREELEKRWNEEKILIEKNRKKEEE